MNNGYVGKFNIVSNIPYAAKIYNELGAGEGSPVPPTEGFLIQDSGFDILQAQNGFPLLYTV